MKVESLSVGSDSLAVVPETVVNLGSRCGWRRRRRTVEVGVHRGRGRVVRRIGVVVLMDSYLRVIHLLKERERGKRRGRKERGMEVKGRKRALAELHNLPLASLPSRLESLNSDLPKFSLPTDTKLPWFFSLSR